MSDLISRQAAIDSIEKHIRFGDELYPLTETDRILNHAFEIAASCVYNLPSAERKKGKWIEDAETYYKAVNKKGGGVNEDTPYFTESNIGCSECLAMFNVIDNETERFDFCPNCGAEMRGEEDES